jgi:hypothetical protein
MFMIDDRWVEIMSIYTNRGRRRLEKEFFIRSTALVGVFTNKTLYRKQISAAPPLLVLSPTRLYTENKYPQHRPCWFFHQQEFMQ